MYIYQKLLKYEGLLQYKVYCKKGFGMDGSMDGWVGGYHSLMPGKKRGETEIYGRGNKGAFND